LPNGNELKELVDAIYYETKPFLIPQTKVEVLEDLVNLHKSSSMDKIIEKVKLLKNKITLILANDDEECPPQIAKQFVGKIGEKKIHYIELDTDHSFARNRNNLVFILCEKLAEGLP
jgi:hypothetical protein